MENQNVVDASLAESEIADRQRPRALTASNPSVFQLKLIIEGDSSSLKSSPRSDTTGCTLIPFLNGLSTQEGEPNLDEIEVIVDFTETQPLTNPVMLGLDDPHCMIASDEGVFNKLIEFESIEVGEILSLSVTWTWNSHEYGPESFEVEVT